MKREKRKISGVLLLDKISGISSNKALQQVKHLFNAEKAGHTGSLDPLASGMLPICLGEATKYCQYLLDADKTYYTVGQLGIKTSTGDAEGEILVRHPVPDYSQETIAAVVNSFKGDITQVPPMYSALKHQGQPLYKLARKGIAIERAPREVHIAAITLLNYEHQHITLAVHCSKGTYIRTLVEDIGEKLGCGAHVIVLRRLAVAHYRADQMINFAQLQQLADVNNLEQQLLPVDTLLPSFPALELSVAEACKLRQGQAINLRQPVPEGLSKLYCEEAFIGLGKIIAHTLYPERLMAA